MRQRRLACTWRKWDKQTGHTDMLACLLTWVLHWKERIWDGRLLQGLGLDMSWASRARHERGSAVCAAARVITQGGVHLWRMPQRSLGGKRDAQTAACSDTRRMHVPEDPQQWWGDGRSVICSWCAYVWIQGWTLLVWNLKLLIPGNPRMGMAGVIVVIHLHWNVATFGFQFFFMMKWTLNISCMYIWLSRIDVLYRIYAVDLMCRFKPGSRSNIESCTKL
jgi:hypothetical protein